MDPLRPPSPNPRRAHAYAVAYALAEAGHVEAARVLLDLLTELERLEEASPPHEPFPPPLML